MVHLDLFIPPHLLQGISRFNRHRWRSQNPARYHGSELSRFATEQHQVLKQFSGDLKAQAMFKAYFKLTACLVSILSGVNAFARTIRENKAQVVNAVWEARNSLDWDSCLTLFGISRSTFDSWKWQVKYPCHQSWLQFCNRRYPHQLTKSEVEKIQERLTDLRFQDWPVVSIAYHAIREKMVRVALKTWYKYARLLGIKRRRKRRSPKYTGLKPTAPNQFWHADITIIKTLDGANHYLYLLSDNFSRKILSWKLADKVCANIRKETLAEAANLIKIPPDLQLITDGGPENCNETVYQFCNANGIAPKVAMKDLPQSNSLVEAHNKIIKHNYLKNREVEDEKQLLLALKQIIHDFNEVRPHCSLNGLTPAEVYAGLSLWGKDPNLPHFQEILKKARVDRVAKNQKNLCKLCEK